MSMMPVIILVFILLTGGLVYFMIRSSTGEKKQRNDYLQAMAHFFEGELIPIAEHDNSFRINFKYRGYECLYEEIELSGLRPGTTSHLGFLKVKTPGRLNLTFSERARTQIRSNAQTLDDVSNARWGTFVGQVRLPKALEEFHAYTNNPQWANNFFNDPKMLKLFTSYKNRDSRGHPLMSLQIVDGVISLEFHSIGGLKPSLLILEYNVTAAEAYLQELIVLAEALKRTDGEKSSE